MAGWGPDGRRVAGVMGNPGICYVGGWSRTGRTGILKGTQSRCGFRALMHRSVLFALILIFGAVYLPAQEQEKTPAKELTQYVRDAQKAGLKDAQIQRS